MGGWGGLLALIGKSCIVGQEMGEGQREGQTCSKGSQVGIEPADEKSANGQAIKYYDT